MTGKIFLGKVAKLTNIALTAGGVIALLVFCNFFYYYTWTGARQFTDATGGVLYLFMPLAAAALLFAFLRLNPTYKITLISLCLSFAAAAYGREFFLYLSEPENAGRSKDEVAELAKRFGVDFDTRDTHQVIADLRTRGVEAVPQVILPLLDKRKDGSVKSAIQIHEAELMPLGGIANKVTVVCNQNGDYLTYKTDEHGFNNPGGLWRSGHTEIAAVGNSFTMGYCVPSDKNFVALIRRQRPATLNVGMAGEGPLHILAGIEEYLTVVKPKTVLWFYSEANSLGELQDEKQSRLLMRYLEDGFKQDLIARQSEIDQALMADLPRRRAIETRNRPRNVESGPVVVDKLLEFIKLSRLRSNLGLVYGRDARETDLEGATMSLLHEILSQANNRVRAWGGKLHFIYLPSWERYARNNPESVNRQRAQVLTYVDGLGIPVIDLHPAFQAQSDPLSLFPFRRSGHYNEKGHRLVAEEVLKVVSAHAPYDTLGALANP